MRLPKFLTSRIIPPSDSSYSSHHPQHRHSDDYLLHSPSLPLATSPASDSLGSSPTSSSELYRGSENMHHVHGTTAVVTSTTGSPLRQHQTSGDVFSDNETTANSSSATSPLTAHPVAAMRHTGLNMSANLSNNTSTTLASTITDDDYADAEYPDDDDASSTSSTASASSTTTSSSSPLKKKQLLPTHHHPSKLQGASTVSPFYYSANPYEPDAKILSEKSQFSTYSISLDHPYTQQHPNTLSAKARAILYTIRNNVFSYSVLRARLAGASRTASYLARSRFIIKNNITVPLWLVALLSLVLWTGALIALLSALGITSMLVSTAGGILPSVGGGPPPIREINGKIDRPFVLGCMEPEVNEPRANAVLVVLARNKEIEGVVSSMTSLERHFNRWFHYPYVFLNDEPFNSTFKEAIRNVTESDVKFGVIDKKTWNFPEWADQEDVDEAIQQQGDKAIMYGGMASYHRMCRFYSGAFFHHPLLADYEWYWRVEPDVKYFCDITYDPFKYMEKQKKVYGFTIVIKELVETVPNLFRQTYGFKKEHNVTTKGMWELFLKKHGPDTAGEALSNSGSVQKNKERERLEKLKMEKKRIQDLQDSLPDEALLGDPNANKVLRAGQELNPEDENEQRLDIHNYDYFAHDVPPYSINGETYNMCHFWSNFEIARLDFFRSPEYQAYFEQLDRSGGFWTERWGDAPVHSLAAGLFLSPSQVHYFRDIGYRHTTIQHCPANAPERQLPHVPYIRDPADRKQIEEDDYWANFDPEVTNGVGCRCRCDTDVVEVEGKDGSCLSEWVDLVGGWV